MRFIYPLSIIPHIILQNAFIFEALIYNILTLYLPPVDNGEVHGEIPLCKTVTVEGFNHFLIPNGIRQEMG